MRKTTINRVIFLLTVGILLMCWIALQNDSRRQNYTQLDLAEPQELVLETDGPSLNLSEIRPDRVIHVNVDGKLVDMDLEDYVFAVVAAEMPASFEPEALKAQAVAARTYTIRKILYGGCNRLKGADVCNRSNHCQAFSTAKSRQANWKDKADAYTAKLRSAVDETRGMILTYDDTPILTLYHASSFGYTEDVEKVYSQTLPYLRSVSSPEEDVKNVTVREEVDRAYFARAVNAKYPKAGLDIARLETQVDIISRYPSGRVSKIRLGSVAISGTDLRHVIEMRSTDFTITFDSRSVIITSRGFGHGVGMSQVGANVMAQEGSTFEDILYHYYTGTKLKPLD